MYRQSSHISTAKSSLPSPAPDESSDSDSDLVTLLEERRRETDADIEAYRWRKEEEFRIFEDELRSRKRRNGVMQSGLSKLHANDLTTNNDNKKKRKAEKLALGGMKSGLGPSKPIVSIDKVTINGMTTPPVSGTPPLSRSLSRSPTNLPISPIRASSGKNLNKSSAPSDKEHVFRGLFTPGYLPLLDSQPSSLPPKSTSPSLSHYKRSLTAPTLPSTSLPSALRAASGTARKRKHVTFRLAHSVVVDPSSSYEETSSPSEDQSENDLPEFEVDSSTETPQSPLATGRIDPESNGVLANLNKTIDEASFFSFDEELDDGDNKLHDYRNVSPSANHSDIVAADCCHRIKPQSSTSRSRKLTQKRSSLRHFLLAPCRLISSNPALL